MSLQASLPGQGAERRARWLCRGRQSHLQGPELRYPGLGGGRWGWRGRDRRALKHHLQEALGLHVQAMGSTWGFLSREQLDQIWIRSDWRGTGQEQAGWKIRGRKPVKMLAGQQKRPSEEKQGASPLGGAGRAPGPHPAFTPRPHSHPQACVPATRPAWDTLAAPLRSFPAFAFQLKGAFSRQPSLMSL